MFFQVEIVRSEKIRGDVIWSTHASGLLGLLSCTDFGEARWAETTLSKILGCLTEELDGRASATAFPVENATECIQGAREFGCTRRRPSDR